MRESAVSSLRSQAFAALLFATTAWGGLFHAGKQVLTRIDPFWFTALRYAGAGLLLALLLVVRRQWCAKAVLLHWRLLTAYGVLGYGMFGILVFLGLARSQPSHGAVIMATMPLSALFMRWLLDGLRPAWWAWVGALIALAGVSLVSGAWSSALSTDAEGHSNVDTLFGDSIAYVGTLGWIGYTRGQAKIPGLTVLEYTAYTAVLAFPGLLAVALVATMLGWARPPTLVDVTAVVPAFTYITAIGTVLAALAFNFGVRMLGANTGVVFITWVPVSALFIAWGSGQAPRTSEWLGTVLVTTALLMLIRRNEFSPPTKFLKEKTNEPSTQ